MNLMEKFHEFYSELHTARAQLDRGEAQARDVHDRLVALLNRQESEAQRDSGAWGVTLYQQAKYAMAALGDEVLLRHDERWMKQLLEAALFSSQCAGEKVFDDIDKMHNLGTAAIELARVYLAVLGLGFQGAFRGLPDPEATIEVYRQKLYTIALGKPGVAGGGHIAPAAYAATMTDGESGLLPHLKPWVVAIVLLVIVYLAGGTALWTNAVAELDERITSILDLKKPTSGGQP